MSAQTLEIMMVMMAMMAMMAVTSALALQITALMSTFLSNVNKSN